MSEKKVYSVLLQGIPQMDQLVFKLIFSVSQRTASRPYAYEMVDTRPEAAQFLVLAEHGHAVPDALLDNGTLVRVTAAGSVDADTATIQRPLIASRVLTLLDKLAERLSVQPAPLVEEPGAETAQSARETVDEPGHDNAPIEFCISEEEASELAIVEDESLANPANVEETRPSTEPVVNGREAANPNPNLVTLNPNSQTEPNRQSPGTPKARVLVVDDSPSVRKQLELELELFEADVDYAEDVASTSAKLSQGDFDLVFLDVVLPDGEGFDICKSIKQKSKATKVVMLTGKATPADKIKGTMAGCDAYLVKPVGRVTFQNTACNYLKLTAQAQVMGA